MLNEEQMWETVIGRQAADFLYAVTTMGIYCRPGCPSPAPLRRNVRFFPDCAHAEAEGFRACRRCDPKGERERLAREVVQDACAAIERSRTAPALDRLAARAGYSKFHFLRLFRGIAGLTPRQYGEAVRSRRLQAALADGARVADAVAEAGYGSESRVYERTGQLLGMTPGRDPPRRRGRGGAHGDRGLPVRPPAGRRHRTRGVFHRLRRARRGVARRSAPPLPPRPDRDRRRRPRARPCARSCTSSTSPRPRSTCRSTCAAPLSRSGSGTRSPASRPARRAAMPRSRA